METVTEVVKNMAGGDGEVTIKRILGEKELKRKMWSVCTGNHSAGIFSWLSRT